MAAPGLANQTNQELGAPGRVLQARVPMIQGSAQGIDDDDLMGHREIQVMVQVMRWLLRLRCRRY